MQGHSQKGESQRAVGEGGRGTRRFGRDQLEGLRDFLTAGVLGALRLVRRCGTLLARAAARLIEFGARAVSASATCAGRSLRWLNESALRWGGLFAVAGLVFAVFAWVHPWDADGSGGGDPSPTRPTDGPDIPTFLRGRCGTEEDGLSPAAWGPDRPLFTQDQFVQRPLLNSDKDNPNYGFEPIFLNVKDALDEQDGGWCGSLRVKDGQVLLFRVYLRNGAAVVMGDEDITTAQGVEVSVAPSGEPASLVRVVADITADNTEPASVYSWVELAADGPFRLDFVRGSARSFTNGTPKAADGTPVGLALDDAIWNGDGSAVGYARLDGVVKPGYRYSQYIILKARVTFLG